MIIWGKKLKYVLAGSKNWVKKIIYYDYERNFWKNYELAGSVIIEAINITIYCEVK